MSIDDLMSSTSLAVFTVVGIVGAFAVLSFSDKKKKKKERKSE